MKYGTYLGLVIWACIIMVYLTGCEHKPRMSHQEVQEIVAVCGGKVILKYHQNYVYDVWCKR